MAVSVQNWSTVKSFKGAGPKVSLKTDLGTVDALELGAVVRETWALTDSAQRESKLVELSKNIAAT